MKYFVLILYIQHICINVWFILFPDECDPQRKNNLRIRVNEYINRAEKLKQLCIIKQSSVESLQNSQSDKKDQSLTVSRQASSLDSSFPYQELRMYI